MAHRPTSLPSDKPRRLKPAETPQQRRARRLATFPIETVQLLEMDDRRRAAARRLPVICDGWDHESHNLDCHDPIGIGA